MSREWFRRCSTFIILQSKSYFSRKLAEKIRKIIILRLLFEQLAVHTQSYFGSHSRIIIVLKGFGSNKTLHYLVAYNYFNLYRHKLNETLALTIGTLN